MSAQRPRYDRWRDINGIHIPIGVRVQQIGVDKTHGALQSRLHSSAEVIAYGRGSRLHVRFDGEERVVTIRPHPACSSCRS
jgi:hypothetical protein